MHPQSVVHSMVEFVDGSTLAQASPPDMRLPIALGLAWPDRVPGAAPADRLDAGGHLGVRAAGRGGLRCRGAVPRELGRRAAPPPRRSTPPTRSASRRSSTAAWTSRRSWTRSPTSSRSTRSGNARPWPRCWRQRSGRAAVRPSSTAPPGAKDDCVTTVGILAFIVALLVSVMLHEAGHFFTARHYGMKATQFFVGFGPTLLSRTKGETEYGVKAIPAGGFVKIVGMTPLEEVDSRGRGPGVLQAVRRPQDRRAGRRFDGALPDHHRAHRGDRGRLRCPEAVRALASARSAPAWAAPPRRSAAWPVRCPPPHGRPACRPRTSWWRSTAPRSSSAEELISGIKASGGSPSP